MLLVWSSKRIQSPHNQTLKSPNDTFSKQNKATANQKKNKHTIHHKKNLEIKPFPAKKTQHHSTNPRPSSSLHFSPPPRARWCPQSRRRRRRRRPRPRAWPLTPRGSDRGSPGEGREWSGVEWIGGFLDVFFLFKEYCWEEKKRFLRECSVCFGCFC